MPGLLIKDLPPALHERLREEAVRNRRSMTREAMVLLEEALKRRAPRELPPPVKGRFPITDAWLRKAIREGRA